MPAVDEHGELHCTWPTEVVERVQRCPHRTAGEQHIVDEHHDPPVDAAGWDVGVVERASRA
jgi:hypothetical protein